MIWDEVFGDFFLLLACWLLERNENLKHVAREIHEKQKKKWEAWGNFNGLFNLLIQAEKFCILWALSGIKLLSSEKKIKEILAKELRWEVELRI